MKCHCSVNVKLSANQAAKKTVRKEFTLAAKGCISDALEAEDVRQVDVYRRFNVKRAFVRKLVKNKAAVRAQLDKTYTNVGESRKRARDGKVTSSEKNQTNPRRPPLTIKERKKERNQTHTHRHEKKRD